MQKLSILIIFLGIQLLAKGDEPLSILKYDFSSGKKPSHWINENSLRIDTASGIRFSRTDSSNIYGLGYKGPFFQNCLNKSLTVSIQAKVRFASEKSEFGIAMSVANADSTIIWDSKNVQVKKVKEWTDIKFEFQIPGSFVIDQNTFIVYGFNRNGKDICDIYELEISIYEHKSKSFLPAISLFSQDKVNTGFLKINDGEIFSLLLDTINNKVKILSSQKDSLISDLVFYIEYLKKQNGKKSNQVILDRFDRFSVQGNNNRIKLSLGYDSKVAVLNILIDVDNISGSVNIKSELVFKTDLYLKQAALVLQYNVEVKKVYRHNAEIDSIVFKNEYWLEKEGILFKGNRSDFLTYRNLESSSMQVSTKDNFLLLNLDYELDHPMLHFPLMKKSKSVFINKSTIYYHFGQVLSGSIKIRSVEEDRKMIRVLKNPNGFTSSMVWTEHADFSDLRIQRALNFGSELINSADSATGGFVGNRIPVTKSVFYDNPTNLKNSERDFRFPENSLSIKGSPKFVELLQQLKNKGHEICLHTPDPFTTTRELAQSSMDYMQKNFGSVNWIDHGYDNGTLSNREDIVCSGLDSTSEIYMGDLWRKYDIKYFWNDFYEDSKLYSNTSFHSFFTIPYSGWDDSYPAPEYFRNPINKDFISWRTTFTLDPSDGNLWDYFFSPLRLNDLVKSGGNCILHCYPARVDSTTGFYSYADKTIVVNPEFEIILGRLKVYNSENKIWLTTVKDLLDYRLLLEKIYVEPGKGSSVIVFNNNNVSVEGFSFVCQSDKVFAGEKNMRIKKLGEDFVITIDLAAKEKLVIEVK